MKVIITMFTFKDNMINWYESKVISPPDNCKNWRTFVDNYKNYITTEGRAEIHSFRCEEYKAYLLVAEKDGEYLKNIIMEEYVPCEIQID